MTSHIETRREPMPSSDRMAQLILENATDFAIFTTDLDGVITSWNPGAETLLGWSEAEAVGRHACMIFTPQIERARHATRR